MKVSTWKREIEGMVSGASQPAIACSKSTKTLE